MLRSGACPGSAEDRLHRNTANQRDVMEMEIHAGLRDRCLEYAGSSPAIPTLNRHMKGEKDVRKQICNDEKPVQEYIRIFSFQCEKTDRAQKEFP